jgi:hypothetical protein
MAAGLNLLGAVRLLGALGNKRSLFLVGLEVSDGMLQGYSSHGK